MLKEAQVCKLNLAIGPKYKIILEDDVKPVPGHYFDPLNLLNNVISKKH